ncbi:hypothetical protein ADL21_03150 [Streptomyces albus subsp. albus]|nr:hypothetical protein ADL21_03150 [Streptomyces albus subsp. albus]
MQFKRLHRSLGDAVGRAAELYFVNDEMTWPARTTSEGLPVCEFDADNLPTPTGFLLWSDDPSAHITTLGRPRAVLWCRIGLTLRVLVLDDAGPYRRKVEELGGRTDPTWFRQVTSSFAGDLPLAFGATIPLDTETDWDQVKIAWTHDMYGRPVRDRYGMGAERLNHINEDQLRGVRTLLGTLLLIRQLADARRGCGSLRPPRQTRQAESVYGGRAPSGPTRPSATSRCASACSPARRATAGPRRAPAVSTGTAASYGRPRLPDKDHPEGKSRKWVGPCLVAPAGCEDAPILGSERVSVLRR